MLTLINASALKRGKIGRTSSPIPDFNNQILKDLIRSTIVAIQTNELKLNMKIVIPKRNFCRCVCMPFFLQT